MNILYVAAAIALPGTSGGATHVQEVADGVVAGAVAGVVLTLIGTRALVPYLYGVRAADPSTYAFVLLLLGATALAATWIPARRVVRLPLVDTLRGE